MNKTGAIAASAAVVALTTAIVVTNVGDDETKATLSGQVIQPNAPGQLEITVPLTHNVVGVKAAEGFRVDTWNRDGVKVTIFAHNVTSESRELTAEVVTTSRFRDLKIIDGKDARREFDIDSDASVIDAEVNE